MGFDSKEEHGIYCFHLTYIQILMFPFLYAADVLYCQIIMTLFFSLCYDMELRLKLTCICLLNYIPFKFINVGTQFPKRGICHT